MLEFILLLSVFLFRSSFDTFLTEILPNPYFIVSIILASIGIFFYTFFSNRKETLAILKIKGVKFEDSFITEWICTYFFYYIYSLTTVVFCIIPGATFIIYNLIRSTKNVHALGQNIQEKLIAIASSSPDNMYIEMLDIVRIDYTLLAEKISVITKDYAFLLGIISIFIIAVTCSRIIHIYNDAAKNIIRWSFLLILLIFGPITILLGTNYYEYHYNNVFVQIGNIINAQVEIHSPTTFYLESIRIFFENNFRLKAFFYDQVLSFKAFSVWLFPILLLITSKLLKKFEISDYTDKVFPDSVAVVIKRIINKLSGVGIKSKNHPIS